MLIVTISLVAAIYFLWLGIMIALSWKKSFDIQMKVLKRLAHLESLLEKGTEFLTNRLNRLEDSASGAEELASVKVKSINETLLTVLEKIMKVEEMFSAFYIATKGSFEAIEKRSIIEAEISKLRFEQVFELITPTTEIDPTVRKSRIVEKTAATKKRRIGSNEPL